MNKQAVATDHDKKRNAISPRRNSVFTAIDFDRDGKQIGYFHVPQSPHDDAWGTVQVPLAVVKNGAGPTILIEAGNHGDEYEGPIALGELLREIDPKDINGRIIAIPAINVRAVEAAPRRPEFQSHLSGRFQWHADQPNFRLCA